MRKKVLLLDQEPEASLGGQAWWSFGGLFLVDSPEQRRLGIKDSRELAWQDWMGTAGFDREKDEDYWAIKWAEAYVDFAAGEKRAWLVEHGIRFFPVVAWAERGGYLADGHGNSVPRFHIVWGTGPALVTAFERRVRAAMEKGLIDYRPRHRVDELVTKSGAVTGVKGPSSFRATPSAGKRAPGKWSGSLNSMPRPSWSPAAASAATLISFASIGRPGWDSRPKTCSPGCRPMWTAECWPSPSGRGGASSTGIACGITRRASKTGTRSGRNTASASCPARPPSGWTPRASGFPSRTLPGFDTLGTLKAILKTGYDYSWFILTQKIVEKEFALSGSEQNPDLTEKNLKEVIRQRVLPGPPDPVKAFLDHGEDFVIADTLPELVEGMNRLTGEDLLDPEEIERQIRARDREIDNSFTKDLQIAAIRVARNYIGDRLTRVAKPHKLLDPKNGPLIAVRLHILTRKTLGGLQTDLSGRVLDSSGNPVPGLYAAGEVAGFGGGGVHGYRALEGTFLGGCLFTGRQAGRALAKALS